MSAKLEKIAAIAIVYAIVLTVLYFNSFQEVEGEGRLRIIDVIDAGNIVSEIKHNYTYDGNLAKRKDTLLFYYGHKALADENGKYYVGDFRTYGRYEEFTANLLPGAENYMTGLADLEGGVQAVRVYIDGSPDGEWKLADRQQMNRAVMMTHRINGANIRRETVTMRMERTEYSGMINSHRYVVLAKDPHWLFWLLSHALLYTAAFAGVVYIANWAYRGLSGVGIDKNRFRRLKVTSRITKKITSKLGTMTKKVKGVRYFLWAVLGCIVYSAGGMQYLPAYFITAAVSYMAFGRGCDEILESIRESRYLPAVFLLVFITSNAVSYLVFTHYPEYQDEHSYIFQAKLFASARISSDAVDPALFSNIYLINENTLENGRRYSKYPPGHPLLLAIGQLIGAIWLIPPILGGLGAVVMYYVAKEYFDKKTAILASLFTATSPFVTLMSATYLSHTTCLLFLAIFTLYFKRTLSGNHRYDPYIAGAALGMVALTRPYAAVSYVPPFAIYCLLAFHSDAGGRVRISADKKTVKRLILLFTTVAVLTAAHLGYNRLQTGDPLVFPFNVANPHESPEILYLEDCGGFSTSCIFERLGYYAKERKEGLMMLFEVTSGWTIQNIAFIAFLFISMRFRRYDLLMLSIVASYILFYLFYFFPGVHFIGPVYLYEAAIPLILLSARGVAVTWDILSAWTGDKRHASALSCALITVLVASSYMYLLDDREGGCNENTGVDFRNRCSIYEIRSTIQGRRIPVDAAREAGLKNAVVYVTLEKPEYWSYAMNSPDRDDGVLYLNANNPAVIKATMDRFRERQCYVLAAKGGKPQLTGCKDYLT